MDITLIMRVEAKDEYFGEGATDGAPGYLPDAAGVAAHLVDELADRTKHDGRIGWRITAVTPA